MCGRLGLQQFISAAGCNVNSNTISRGQRRDAKRVAQAQMRQLESSKKRRLEISIATSRAQQEYEKLEGGPSYASGAF
ncbi:hypothetical protein PoB_001502200 [Plakobranchus ocellatus]|uniref:Uncharacterized protein n=1 Tax=Plakobranchus ocellatus TaxID=259542 RepID=A0AAV3YZZ1_9GAST|nr:hypothetical protein PoB_001502200 [Plakobranchus ocellatus]